MLRRRGDTRSPQLWRPAAATFVLLLCWPECCSAQDANVCSNASNDTNGSSCNITKPCPTLCCSENIPREAYLACKEYVNMGLTEEICRTWEGYARTDCELYCSNCTRIALTIYGQCLFFLQSLMPTRLARAQCTVMRNVFEKARCPAACLDEANCHGEAFDECEWECGNYREAPGIPSIGCTCWRDRNKYGAPYECTEKSETGLKGEMVGRGGLVHSCAMEPQHCKQDAMGQACGLYKYCPTDVCIVRNITCPWLDDCLSLGVCLKYNGECAYQKRLDGEVCTDDRKWTHNDTCKAGTCVGIEDRCMRYGVACDTLNSCLVPEKRMTYDGNMTNCDPGSGACMFKSAYDNAVCTSYPGGDVDGRCRDGLCYKQHANKCAVRPTCPDLGQCYETPECDNFTGNCIDILRKDGSACDDGFANTYRDKCIEGRCVGDHIAEPTFQTMGEGDCIDSMPALRQPSGVLVDHTPIARYYVDALDQTVCEKQCFDEPECIAYSFGYHSCAIYGTSRQQNLDAEVWGNPWQLESTRAHVLHPVVCWQKTEGATWDYIEYLRTFLFPVTLCTLLGVPAIFVGFASEATVKRSWRRINGLPDKDDDDSNSARSRVMSRLGGNSLVQRPGTTTSSQSASSFSKLEKVRLEAKTMEIDTNAIEDVRLGPTSPGLPGMPAMLEPPLTDPRGAVVHA